MKIFHIATTADWEQAARAGEYRMSTLGRTLDEEGFIHAAWREQIPDVYERYYASVEEPLVLLHIEPDRLTSPVVDERIGDKVFPHIQGPINRQAVVEIQPLSVGGQPVTFSRLMLREMAWRMGAGVLFMVLVTVALLAVSGANSPVLSILAILVGAGLGVVVWRWMSARFG